MQSALEDLKNESESVGAGIQTVLTATKFCGTTEVAIRDKLLECATVVLRVLQSTRHLRLISIWIHRTHFYPYLLSTSIACTEGDCPKVTTSILSDVSTGFGE